MPQIWAGADIAKKDHHCVVVDERGERRLSRRVFNDEPALLELMADVLALSTGALWAVDVNHGGASPLIGLLRLRPRQRQHAPPGPLPPRPTPYLPGGPHLDGRAPARARRDVRRSPPFR
jgi:hypothetical protein